jgi:hypothetical protein
MLSLRPRVPEKVFSLDLDEGLIEKAIEDFYIIHWW